MSKFEAIEMSKHVALHPKVEEHKILGLFGRHYQYAPTHSRLSSYRNYYNTADGESFLHLSEAPAEVIGEQISTIGERNTTADGEYRLDMCLSDDARFVAFQVFKRNRGEYEPVSIIRFLEGDEAQSFEQLLA